MKVILAVLLVFAAAVRVLAASGDLWLDEIWSLQTAREVAHWWQLLTSVPSDNNHHLNSIWLRMVSQAESPVLLRGLSLAAGTSTILAMRFSPVLETDWQRSMVMVAGTLSYPMILYSSEARGYALAMLCAVLALDAACRGARGSLTFLTAVGILSHATFAFAWIGIAAWLVTRRAFGLLRTPLLVVIVYAVAFLPRLQVGGGDPVSPAIVVEELLRYCFGGRLLAAMVIGSILLYLWNESRGWLTLLIAGSGAALLAASQTDYVHFRYFVVLLPFWLLFAVRAADAIARKSRLALACVTLAGTCHLALQVAPVVDLLRHGRGEGRALARMLENADVRAAIASTHDFRARVLLEQYTNLGDRICSADRAEYLLVQRERPLSPSTFVVNGREFRFARHFPTAPLSGLHTYVYRAVGTKTAPTSSSYTAWYRDDSIN